MVLDLEEAKHKWYSVQTYLICNNSFSTLIKICLHMNLQKTSNVSGFHIKNIVTFKLHLVLTPKGRRPFFGPFLDIGQAIVDAIFVQKISNFWWTCGLVLASRRTNFYKIPIFGYTVMPQKHLFSSSGHFGKPKKNLV